jgi:hypothetical protein
MEKEAACPASNERIFSYDKSIPLFFKTDQ